MADGPVTHLSRGACSRCFFGQTWRTALAVAVILGVILPHKSAVLIVKVGTRLDDDYLTVLEILLFLFYLPLGVPAVAVLVFTVVVMAFF